MSDFEFNNVPTPQSILSVEDNGCCAIEASNDLGEYYYLVIKTILGETLIAKCGPVIPDIEMLPNKFSTELSRMEYDMKKVSSIINKWLNDNKKLTTARSIDIEEALLQFRDLGTYLLDGGE